MPRNDRSDSLSIRGEDDPRRPLKALEQEAELELGSEEAHQTGGPEHMSDLDREGVPRERRPASGVPRGAADRTTAGGGRSGRGSG